jgi:hypothetical protein
MITVKEIEKAVEPLPPYDLNQFLNWFEADARNGRLGSLVNDACAEYKTGETSPS